MKKGLKIIIGILLVIGIGIGGFAYRQHKEHEKMVAIATSEEAKKVYEDMLRKKVPNAFSEDSVITSYQIDTETLYYNPMGGMEVTLYINGDKELEYQCGIIENTSGKLESSGAVYSAKLGELFEEAKSKDE